MWIHMNTVITEMTMSKSFKSKHKNHSEEKFKKCKSESFNKSCQTVQDQLWIQNQNGKTTLTEGRKDHVSNSLVIEYTNEYINNEF